MRRNSPRSRPTRRRRAPSRARIEPGRYTVILEPRANARFLSLMIGLFNARTAEGPVGNYFSGKQPGTTKVGEKLFSDQVTIKSDIGNTDPAPDADRHRRHGRPSR